MPPAELLDAHRSVVVVIDEQGKLMQMVHRPELVRAATIRLMKLADIFRVPVLLTEQYPKGLGPTDPEVRAAFDDLTTDTAYLEKLNFGCCGDARFELELKSLRPKVRPEMRQVVVAGLEAHVCVMQTVIELLRAGQQVYVCWECVSGRGEEYRLHALDRMRAAGAVISNHESVAFEWARTKEHPAFRDLNELLRGGQLT
ncbi:MAG: isochorismatase family protein [Acidobacteriota bacterium]|nr:isochorismatase family protein [Acidobacteriota bacterium]